MAQGDANRVSVYISEETAWGETPATPTMTALPINSETLEHNKATVLSNRIRSDRMRDTLAEVGISAQGDIGFELSFADYDLLLEGALGSDYVVATTGAQTDISAATSDDSFNRAAGSFVTDGFVVGMNVKVSGFVAAGDNGIHKVTAVAALKLTVAGSNLTVEAAGASVTIRAKMLRNGIVKKSYLLEKRFEDLAKYLYFAGMKVNTLSLSVTSQEIVSGQIAFMGKQGVAGDATISGSSVAHSTNQVLNATSNVGSLTEAGAALATAIRAIQLQLNNNDRTRPAVGSRPAIGIAEGTVDITGTMDAYFEDRVLYTKFEGHTASSLSFRFTDADGNVLIVTLPRLFFSKALPNASSINTDVMLPLEFTAVRDTVTNCEIQIDSLAVA